jgi:hypothetical protein
MANNALIGIAGVHYVVAELSRRGLVALPTIENTAAYDIVALNVEGTRHANIQVKSSSKKASFFPMPPPKKIRAGPRDFYVLVRWLESEERFECFLLTGKVARAAVLLSRRCSTVNVGASARAIAKASFRPCISTTEMKPSRKDGRGPGRSGRCNPRKMFLLTVDTRAGNSVRPPRERQSNLGRSHTGFKASRTGRSFFIRGRFGAWSRGTRFPRSNLRTRKYSQISETDLTMTSPFAHFAIPSFHHGY